MYIVCGSATFNTKVWHQVPVAAARGMPPVMGGRAGYPPAQPAGRGVPVPGPRRGVGADPYGQAMGGPRGGAAGAMPAAGRAAGGYGAPYGAAAGVAGVGGYLSASAVPYGGGAPSAPCLSLACLIEKTTKDLLALG